jgi:PleD family two-component response regulator
VLEEVPSKAATVRPAAVILDMNDEKVDAFRALEQARESAGLSGVPILAFANHEEVATWQRARELGVSKIVSRNEFSSRTRELVAELISHQPSAVSQAES